MKHPDPARSSTGLLRVFHEGGLLSWGDVHTAQTVSRLFDETEDNVKLAFALTVRALRAGSVCLDLGAARGWAVAADEDSPDIPARLWPDPALWAQAVHASPLVTLGPDAPTGRPLRLVDGLLYLERYWQEERSVAEEFARRSTASPGPVLVEKLAEGLDAIFGRPPVDRDQQMAGAVSVLSPVTIVAGGPGTGKTTTIAAIIALLGLALGGSPRIALAAPTGKAAARVEDAIGQSQQRFPLGWRGPLTGIRATTLHRLLGWTPEARTRFRHNRNNPLPHDAVIVDEASMVSVTMMARLLEALRPEARLILVGDPDQLAPVEAGAVLADMVAAPHTATSLTAALRDMSMEPSGPVVRLGRNWRFDGAISALAEAVRTGDGESALALLRSGDPAVSLVEVAGSALKRDVVDNGAFLVAAARDGRVEDALAALERHRLLCAHRRGPFGVSFWSRQVEAWLAEAIGDVRAGREWYPGRAVLVTENLPDVGLSNGDTGVVVAQDGQLRVWFGRGPSRRSISPYLLDSVQTVHAMTVHKAQGSQFERVTLLLPPPDSPLLTRELLYTAVTRATTAVALIGSEESLRRAVRQRVLRASGLNKGN